MAGKAKDKRAKSMAFFSKNNPGMDVEKVAKQGYSGNGYGKQSNRGYQSYGGNKGREKSNEPVSVPYNFVSLPKQVIPAEFFELDSYTSEELKKRYKEHVIQNGKNTGYIDIDILTKTPLFIGGNVIKKNGEEYQEFFGGNDNPIIPGSSLKSMIKQVLKITASGGFRAYDSKLGTGDFEDRHLYFRGLGSSVKNFRDYYNDTMVESDPAKKESRTKALAGFIVKTKDHNFYVVNADFDILKYKEHSKSGVQPKTASIDWQNGYVDIHTGFMNNKKSFVRIRKPGNFSNGRILIPEDVINSYTYDINRKTIDLLEIDKDNKDENDKSVKPGKSGDEAKKYTNCSDISYVVPCFYKTDGNVVEHFGHGRFYRIAYHSSIESRLPKSMKLQNHIVDLTDSILGYASSWGGRVSFSEAHLANRPKWCECSKPHPLMGPKPTSFQFYLKQDTEHPNSAHNHWDTSNASIRGYKLYWHQPIAKANSWKNPSVKEGDKRSKYIQPIDSGMKFQSRIYFNNLSDIELGALLLALNLDTEAGDNRSILYKLGMGKSIGLGSIELSSSLHIVESDKRYQNLFDNNTWQLGVTDSSKDIFIKAFLKYRNDSLGENLSSYNQMLEELFTMMDWNLANGDKRIKKWGEAVSMMSIDNDPHGRFKDRTKLGTPSEFIKAWSKK